MRQVSRLRVSLIANPYWFPGSEYLKEHWPISWRKLVDLRLKLKDLTMTKKNPDDQAVDAMTVPDDEAELLCLLIAERAGELKADTPRSLIDRMAQQLVAECVPWEHDVGSLLSKIAKTVSELCGSMDPSPKALVNAYRVSCELYEGKAKVRTGRQAILYAGILKRRGLISDEGETTKGG